jgi:diaminopimelate epimerase
MNSSYVLVLLLLLCYHSSVSHSYRYRAISFPVARRLSMTTTTSTSTASVIPFAKYQGLGNDFILIDNTKSTSPALTPEQAIKICNRNFGIGGDGVIFALPGSNGCDYTMRIYNSDGSEPQMCGNGIRCMAKFLVDIEKRATMEATYKIWTNAGVIIPKISSDGLVTVDMGRPILKSIDVPTTLAATREDRAIESPFEALAKTYKATCVSMGNPHAVSAITIAPFPYMFP